MNTVTSGNKPPRITSVDGKHRRPLSRNGLVAQHTQSTHVGPHHHGWAEQNDCPRCFPASYAIDFAKHRGEGAGR